MCKLPNLKASEGPLSVGMIGYVIIVRSANLYVQASFYGSLLRSSAPFYPNSYRPVAQLGLTFEPLRLSVSGSDFISRHDR